MITIELPDNISIDRQVIKALVGFVLFGESHPEGRIFIHFVSDEQLLLLNNQFLGHDYFTDIISFGGLSDGFVSGELFISFDRAADNAKMVKCDFNCEIYRLLIHGTLHLCGYVDASEDERRLMTIKENDYLNSFLMVPRETNKDVS